jgi:hypothetical protein
LNEKGKHVNPLVKAKWRNLKALMREILEQKALPVVQLKPVDDSKEDTVNTEPVSGSFHIVDCRMSREENELWDDTDFDIGCLVVRLFGNSEQLDSEVFILIWIPSSGYSCQYLPLILFPQIDWVFWMGTIHV